ncbi:MULTISPECIES: N-acetyltransferase [Caproicibacterium]|uniref:GNAT family N-acetyltransferase n=1 Tax=Caproicibacterium argilliputei TaxID=3030016 RepID=A0AA97H3Q3_9FIRM|nr:GNAT family N-acetyltransferase [Caproicibacterium argilliputei]WOC32553.1 GNAT family N-acetyltransferase [Caproicibacterium argilliputei]
MLACAEQLARAQSVRAIRLNVSDKNLPSVRLYEACDYRYIGDADLGLGAYGLTNFLLYEKGL